MQVSVIDENVPRTFILPRRLIDALMKIFSKLQQLELTITIPLPLIKSVFCLLSFTLPSAEIPHEI
jgi:hypothetical protein